MAVNNFKPFGVGKVANVTTQADYEALPALDSGFSSGKASSAQINKALRQGTVMSSVLAQFIANLSGKDVLDDGNTQAVLNNLITALKANGSKDFLQTANSLAEIKAAGPAAVANVLANLGLGDTISMASGALQTANNFSEIKAVGATAVSAAQSNLGLGSSASRNVGDKENQIPDMSSFIYQNIGGVIVSRLPSGLTIQAGRNATNSAGVQSINLPVAVVDGLAFACEIGVSGWIISDGIYSFITTYGTEVKSNSTILVRGACWRASDKNFISGSTAFSWFVVGKS